MNTACVEGGLLYVRKEGRRKGNIFVVVLALILKNKEKFLNAALGRCRSAVIKPPFLVDFCYCLSFIIL